MASRERLDILVWKRGLAPSRAKAQALVLAGQVAVDGQPCQRAGTQVDSSATITLLSTPSPYVSRGGEKLAAALQAFAVDIHRCIAIDVGASTGGFTDCLLQAGAAQVHAVDVGYGQLHWRLRTDPRVVVYERTNARYLQPQQFPQPFTFFTIDASFISQRLLFPAVVPLLAPYAGGVVLIKPQFEVGKGQVGKGGVVVDPQLHQQALYEVLMAAQEHGMGVQGGIPSPLLGPKGNREFLAYLRLSVPLLPSAQLATLCQQLACVPCVSAKQ